MTRFGDGVPHTPVDSVRAAVPASPERGRGVARDSGEVGKIDKLTVYLEHRRDGIQPPATEVVEALLS